MKEGYKTTSIGEIPESWEVVKLGDLCDVRDGTHDSPKYFEQGVPFVTSKNLTDSRLDFSDIKYISADDHRNFSKRSHVENGDILFGMIGTVGKPVIVNEEFEFSIKNVALIKFRNNTKVVNTFALNVLKSFIIEKQFRKISNGGVLGFVALGNIRALDFPLPPIGEQQKIAEILSTVDEKIQVIEEQINQTSELKKGLMQRLFTKGIGHTQFKASPLGEIPEGWSCGKIGDFCSVQNNLRKPFSAEVRKSMKGQYPYYGPTGIIDRINEYQLDGEYTLIGEDGDHFLKYESWSMTRLVSGKFNVNNHAHLLQGKDNCLTAWIHTYFQHRNIVSYLTRQGAGRYKLTKETLIQLPMLLPPIDEQEKIAEILSAVDAKKQVLKQKKESFQKLKKGLMQHLLTGKIRVNQTNAKNDSTRPQHLQTTLASV